MCVYIERRWRGRLEEQSCNPCHMLPSSHHSNLFKDFFINLLLCVDWDVRGVFDVFLLNRKMTIRKYGKHGNSSWKCIFRKNPKLRQNCPLKISSSIETKQFRLSIFVNSKIKSMIIYSILRYKSRTSFCVPANVM